MTDIKALIAKAERGETLTDDELLMWQEFQKSRLPMLKQFDKELKVFDTLPELSQASETDAEEIERLAIGWHLMAKASRFRASQYVYWLYKYWCFDNDGNQIRGAWTKLYERLGMGRKTAIEYRETARILMAKPMLLQVLDGSKLDELSCVPHKLLAEKLAYDDDGNPTWNGDRIDIMDEHQLRETIREKEKQLAEGEKQLEEMEEKNTRLVEEVKNWEQKYKKATSLPREIGEGVAHIRAGLGEILQHIEAMQETGEVETQKATLEAIYLDLLDQVTALGRKAGILAVDYEPADHPEPTEDEMDFVKQYKAQLKKSGVK